MRWYRRTWTVCVCLWGMLIALGEPHIAHGFLGCAALCGWLGMRKCRRSVWRPYY